MKDLRLPLKKKCFEMTKSGEKTEDYREITAYWKKRLSKELSHGVAIGYLTCEATKKGLTERGFKYFKTNIMTLGYPKKGDKDKIIQFEHKGIEVREGKEEWGAEPGKLYFVIKHGKKL